MFCPKCGHQQVSDDMRFCSRCGFQMTGVAELLIKNESGPAAGQLEKRAPRVSRRGARLLFLSIVSAPIFLVFSFAFDSPLPLFGAFFFFLAGLAHIVYQWIFGENLLPESRDISELASAARNQYLPPLREIPASDFFGRDTADFTPPPSITESTTKLLENESELPFKGSGKGGV
jgi:hypothetical protein